MNTILQKIIRTVFMMLDNLKQKAALAVVRASVWFTRQWTNYTCGTTVFRMCVKQFAGRHYTERAAKVLCRTDENGTADADIRRALRLEGCRVGPIPSVTVKNIEKALKKDRWVVVSDYLTYSEPHIIVVCASAIGCFIVLDPAIGVPTPRSKSYVTRSAKHEGFSVFA